MSTACSRLAATSDGLNWVLDSRRTSSIVVNSKSTNFPSASDKGKLSKQSSEAVTNNRFLLAASQRRDRNDHHAQQAPISRNHALLSRNQPLRRVAYWQCSVLGNTRAVRGGHVRAPGGRASQPLEKLSRQSHPPGTVHSPSPLQHPPDSYRASRIDAKSLQQLSLHHRRRL